MSNDLFFMDAKLSDLGDVDDDKYIEDARVSEVVNALGGGSGGTSDHRQLTNRSAANQHPASAIQMDDGSTVEASVAALGSVKSDTYANIKALADAGKLIPGNMYEINDYETIYVQPVSSLVRSDSTNLFNVVVRAITPNRFAPEAWASRTSRTQPTGSVITSATPLDRWRILYDISNDAGRYVWATPTGKGVIYRMEDHHGNDLPYDFYNVKSRRYKVTATTTAATSFVGKYLSANAAWTNFTVDANDFVDLPTFDFSKTITNNRMAAPSTGTRWSLPNNVFQADCLSNGFGTAYNANNTVVGNCTNNIFDTNTAANVFGGTCQNSKIGTGTSSNVFAGNCVGVSFGVACTSNTFAANFLFVDVGSRTTGKDFSAVTQLYGKTYNQSISTNAGGVTEIRWYDSAGTMQRATV